MNPIMANVMTEAWQSPREIMNFVTAGACAAIAR